MHHLQQWSFWTIYQELKISLLDLNLYAYLNIEIYHLAKVFMDSRDKKIKVIWPQKGFFSWNPEGHFDKCMVIISIFLFFYKCPNSYVWGKNVVNLIK